MKRGCSILRIKDTAGIWLEELPAIQQKFIMDFSSRFTSATSSRSGVHDSLATSVVTAEENAALIQPVTDEEIYTAVFQMDPYKAPGSDGFGASFYQDHWPVIRDLLCVAIKDFFPYWETS